MQSNDDLLKYVDRIKDKVEERTAEKYRIKKELEERESQEKLQRIILFVQNRCYQELDPIVFNLIDWNPCYTYIRNDEVHFKFNILGVSALFIVYSSGNIFLAGMRKPTYYTELAFIDSMLIQAVKDAEEILQNGMLYD